MVSLSVVTDPAPPPASSSKSTMQTNPSVENRGVPAATSVVLFSLVLALVVFVVLR